LKLLKKWEKRELDQKILESGERLLFAGAVVYFISHPKNVCDEHIGAFLRAIHSALDPTRKGGQKTQDFELTQKAHLKASEPGVVKADIIPKEQYKKAVSDMDLSRKEFFLMSFDICPI